jgi:hypothetical protein
LSLLSELRAIEKQAAEELGQWREKREPVGNGAEALPSITVQFVDSPSMAAARESAKLLAPAAEPKRGGAPSPSTHRWQFKPARYRIIL